MLTGNTEGGLMNPLTKGKVKTVYAVDNVNHVLIEYHDKVTAGNGEKEANPLNKGGICCQISGLLFKYLEKEGIRTHHIDTIGHTMLCHKAEVLPVEVVVRNYAAGSFVRQTPFEQGLKFEYPLVEFYLKDDDKNDPLLNEPRLKLMGIYGYQKDKICIEAVKVSKVLTRVFEVIGLDLVDFKLEFAFNEGELMVVDEISPDSMRLWKKGTQQSMDKDLFRKDTGDIMEAYKKILMDLQGVLQ
jgi:phosphoribosylaminoimidazole-succinocarboxamide synthase